jgi:hypothetical protein
MANGNPIDALRGTTSTDRGLADFDQWPSGGVLRNPYDPARPIFPPEIVPGGGTQPAPKRKRPRRVHPKSVPVQPASSAPPGRTVQQIDMSHYRKASEWVDTPTWAKVSTTPDWLDWAGPFAKRVGRRTLDFAGEAADTAAKGVALLAVGALALGAGTLEVLKDAAGWASEAEKILSQRSQQVGKRNDGALRKRFIDDCAREIAAQKGHPLKKLLDPTTGGFKGRSVRSPLVSVHAGHTISRFSGAAPYFALEDPALNAFWNVGESVGAVFMKPAVVIGGVPVEYKTAWLWEQAGILTKGTLKKAPFTVGWHR